MNLIADSNRLDFDTGRLMEWWRRLNEDRGQRARLRRCHSVDEVSESIAFQHRARPALTEAGLRGSTEQLATIAGLLSHVREHDPLQQRFAARMATADSAEGRPPVSEMRFRRLLRIRSREKLYRPLRRVLYMLDSPPRANVITVARDVYYWGRAVHRRWARDYHAERFHSEPAPEAADRAEMWQAWWDELQQPGRRGERAELRRCHTLHEVMLTSGYHRLLHYLLTIDAYAENDRWQQAAVVGTLAHIDENDTSVAFPVQMAISSQAAAKLTQIELKQRDEVLQQVQKGKLGSPHLSGLRFRRLLQVSDRSTLFRRLTRTLNLLGGRANVEDVARAVFWWNDSTRRSWALDYYTHAPRDEP